jgi:hypothetical protein
MSRGSSSATVANSSSVVEEAGKGRQTVEGSDKPGKESSRTLMMGSILRGEVQALLRGRLSAGSDAVSDERTDVQRHELLLLLIGQTETGLEETGWWLGLRRGTCDRLK